ncbi:prolyl oligopeptidase family serine peptidase [Neiella marina]|uniref:Prolyl oligopeptidase family serine peptidase n=1 Tax=Neiella holothuriorum TaxID=2870530 RepID=A0ABS7EI87_9GAMM|nr:alpha/beta hydrolase-fold protein [Neiella holothuriorum]MBW8191954.1 prolyl oligopeptidase family serine peptidase [Neiella holothuriorum]
MLIMGSVSAAEQFPNYTLNNIQVRQLQTDLTENKHYELHIRLPADYQTSAEKHYPVVYYLDAYWHTALINSVIGGLVYDRKMPDVIAVGIGYPGQDIDYGKLRVKDFIPKANPATNAGAKAFLEFIEQQVIPYIEKEFRVNPSRRALVGNSYGGLFALYTLFNKPNLFNMHIAVTPAWYVNDRQLLQDEARLYRNGGSHFAVTTEQRLNSRFYMAVGGAETVPHVMESKIMAEVLASRNYADWVFQFEIIEGEAHGGVTPEAYNRGFRHIFNNRNN